MAAPRHRALSGLTRRECQVLELWDAGLSMARITRLTDTPREKVGRIVSGFCEGNETRLHRNAMAAGSAALLAAMEAHNG